MTRNVFVVDDDAAVRDSIRWLLESAGFDVETFASADEFLVNHDRRQPGCLVLDLRLVGMSGLELQQRLRDDHVHLPIVMISGHADVAIAVRAVKAGAADFLEKPFRHNDLIDCLRRALDEDDDRQRHEAELDEAASLLASLSSREREVLDAIARGLSNKLIARSLHVCVKTVEFHRARIMKKLGAQSVADLVRVTLGARATEATMPTTPQREGTRDFSRNTDSRSGSRFVTPTSCVDATSANGRR